MTGFIPRLFITFVIKKKKNVASIYLKDRKQCRNFEISTGD